MASKGKQPLWLGGTASAMAACCTHPLDQTKYRMQVQTTKQPMLRALYTFATRDGIRSLWQGLSASMLRQSTYSTARFGIYNALAQYCEQRAHGTKKLSASTTVACAGLAGGLAGLVGNPSEVVLVRMCADGAKDPKQRFGYANAVQGMLRVGREEGVRAFFKGLGPNVVRSVLMNVSQIAVYNATKSTLLSHPSLQLRDNTPTHILASLTAGTVATTVCAPADVLKSRLQSTRTAANSTAGNISKSMKSQNLYKLLTSTIKNEGAVVLMRGWTPAWLRLAPNTVLMFVFMEQLQRLFL